jgi:hypothetical protein
MVEGRYEHAVFTTYSFNLPFFEKWVLGALWAARVRNVVVFVDPTRLGEALEDREGSVAGRAYDLVASRRARLAFHPKLILLAGTEGQRLCVSSANLTADGLLRNLEVGAGFDSGEPSHRQVIRQGAEFLRRLSQEEECPPHTAELVERATGHAIELEGSGGRYSFIHNLDEPLATHFAESTAVRATAPYVTIEAAHHVGASGLDVIVDGENLAAPQGFFDGQWRIEARKFERRLHGKAYWMGAEETGDLILGSPNLSGAALLRTASHGNVEAAVAIQGGAGELSTPPGDPWTEGDLRDAAVSRFEASSEGDEEAVPTSFNAWAEAGRLKTTGVPSRTEIEVWNDGLWISLGRIADGEMEIGERPLPRIRAMIEGRIAYAIVASPSRLRRRAASGASSDEAGSAAKLPLDLETVRVLEGVLGELYDLSERIAVKRPPRPPRPGPDDPPASRGLEEWRPRHEGDEPRIPPLYLDEWQRSKDALLTLIGRVLQTDEGDASSEPQDVVDEHIDIEELEAVAEEKDSDEEKPEPPPPSTRKALGKYRDAFDRLLKRGTTFVTDGRVDELVSAAFVYLLRLIEELAGNTVEVDGEPEPLGDPKALLEAEAALLLAFQPKGIEEPIALRAAGPHLASCLREIDEFDSIIQERLERMAFATASDMLEAGATSLSIDDEAALSSYAERARWPGIAKTAAENLENVELCERPYPLICGSSQFAQRLASPTWDLIAFAAPAGLEDTDPFAIAVLNHDLESPAAVHLLACEPGAHGLLEAMKRRADDRWVVWSYDCHSRLDLERYASTRPDRSDWRGAASEFDDLADAPEPVGAVATLVDRYCSRGPRELRD